jgi:hypothetical protein
VPVCYKLQKISNMFRIYRVMTSRRDREPKINGCLS